MNGLKIDERTVTKSLSLSGDIAQTLADRLRYGSVVVVCREPGAMLSSTMKQWHKLLRQIERQRASTIDLEKIRDYMEQLKFLRRMKMATIHDIEDPNVDVGFVSIDAAMLRAPLCHTVIVATPADREALHKITAFIPKGGAAIIYKV
jgi:hypothetical protein